VDIVDIFVNSVADGLGGSGSEKVIIDDNFLYDNRQPVNHLYITSRTANYVLSDIIKTHPKTLIDKKFKEVFEERLNQEFQNIKKIFGEKQTN